MERKTEDKHALEQKNQNWEEKKRALESYMDELAGADILVAFSGGADSALLLAAPCRKAAGCCGRRDRFPHLCGYGRNKTASGAG